MDLRPNLFEFSPSELTQDAMICWLLSWAKPEYKTIDAALNDAARFFLRKLFEVGSTQIQECKTLEIRKQYRNIDILLIVNEEYVILIEDKVDAGEHSDQLERYLRAIQSDGYQKNKIIPIYLKTGNQSDYTTIAGAGYFLFRRGDFLQVLEHGKSVGVQNSIFLDFFEYLTGIETQTNSYLTVPLQEWSDYSWQGFFVHLQKSLRDSDWCRVNNPGGGFWGFWWRGRGREGEKYLQLEEDKLCFKIGSNKNKQKENAWHDSVMQAAQGKELRIVHPRRMRSGNSTTIAVVDGDYRQTDDQGLIDMSKTIEFLREIERFFDSVAE
jgi:hypothetical protein